MASVRTGMIGGRTTTGFGESLQEGVVADAEVRNELENKDKHSGDHSRDGMNFEAN